MIARYLLKNEAATGVPAAAWGTRRWWASLAHSCDAIFNPLAECGVRVGAPRVFRDLVGSPNLLEQSAGFFGSQLAGVLRFLQRDPRFILATERDPQISELALKDAAVGEMQLVNEKAFWRAFRFRALRDIARDNYLQVPCHAVLLQKWMCEGGKDGGIDPPSL